MGVVRYLCGEMHVQSGPRGRGTHQIKSFATVLTFNTRGVHDEQKVVLDQMDHSEQLLDFEHGTY